MNKRKKIYLHVISLFLLLIISNASLATLITTNDFIDNGDVYNTPGNDYITFTHTFDTSLGQIISATLQMTYSAIANIESSVVAGWVYNDQTDEFDPHFIGQLSMGEYSFFNLDNLLLSNLSTFGELTFSFTGNDPNIPGSGQQETEWSLISSNLKVTYETIPEPAGLLLFLSGGIMLLARKRS